MRSDTAGASQDLLATRPRQPDRRGGGALFRRPSLPPYGGNRDGQSDGSTGHPKGRLLNRLVFSPGRLSAPPPKPEAVVYAFLPLRFVAPMRRRASVERRLFFPTSTRQTSGSLNGSGSPFCSAVLPLVPDNRLA